jgi:hypothetical protein
VEERGHFSFLSPASVLRLVESICRGVPNKHGPSTHGHWLAALLWFLNGAGWAVIVLHLLGDLR